MVGHWNTAQCHHTCTCLIGMDESSSATLLKEMGWIAHRLLMWFKQNEIGTVKKPLSEPEITNGHKICLYAYRIWKLTCISCHLWCMHASRHFSVALNMMYTTESCTSTLRMVFQPSLPPSNVWACSLMLIWSHQTADQLKEVTYLRLPATDYSIFYQYYTFLQWCEAKGASVDVSVGQLCRWQWRWWWWWWHWSVKISRTCQ